MYGHPSHLNPYGYPARSLMKVRARKAVEVVALAALGAAVVGAAVIGAAVIVSWWF